jgi:aspartate kinase
MKVCKFGGTSLAGPEKVREACCVVQADSDRRIVVVSAPGKRSPDDTKVTDLLIACATRRLAGESAEAECAAVMNRFGEICRAFDLAPALTEELDQSLRSRLDADMSHRGQYLDAVKAAGEDLCAKMVAAALCSLGTDARYLSPRDAGLLLSDDFGNAQLLPESYENLAALRGAKGVTVFPGFFGYTREGAVVTFPRGGSDITGSILAAAVEADVYENFTDVDSVLAADPWVVPDACPVRKLTYREMRELSYAGFSVLHDEAILPVVKAGIPICIKHTSRPEEPGTWVVAKRDYEGEEVVGIACGHGFCQISLGKYLMNREVGFGRRMLQIIEEEGLSYEHIPSGIDEVSIILSQEGLDTNTEQRILDRFRRDLGVHKAEVERGLALIMIVGENMRFHVGIAAKATRAIADAGVNIEVMNQGASEISVMFGVKEDDCAAAVRSLYDAFLRTA